MYSIKVNMRNIYDNARGLSLIEVMLYVAILGMLLSVVMNTLFLIGRSYAGLRVGSQIATAASSSFERILLEGRSGASINAGVSTFNSDSSVLVFVRPDGTPVEFYVSNGRLYLEENNVVLGPLTPASVTVSSFYAEKITGSSIDGVKVNLTLQSAYKNISRTETFHLSMFTRN